MLRRLLYFFRKKPAEPAEPESMPTAAENVERVQQDPIATAGSIDIPHYVLTYANEEVPSFRKELPKSPPISNHVDRLPFPILIVPGEQALEIVEQSRASEPNWHYFIMGDEFSVDRIADNFEPEFAQHQRSPQRILAAAENLTPEEFLKAWKNSAEEKSDIPPPTSRTSVDLEEKDDGFAIEVRANARFEMDNVEFQGGFPRGPWPANPEPNHHISAHIDILTGKFHQEVAIGKVEVPVTESWRSLAELGFGGFNECPPPEVHVALARVWAEKYGAVLTSMTFDTIEFAIERPIMQKDEAIEMAKLQYAYCPDIVDQGTGTIDELAAVLIGATVWYFWWD